MSTCVTRAASAWAASVLLCGAAGAEELELRGEGTLGVNLYDIQSPWDDDDVSSFFDQHHYVRDKDKNVPFFIDLTHLDVGFFREDDTSLVRLERWSPWAWNQRAELEVDWERLRIDVDTWRFRTDELRVFPTGTLEAFPAFGTRFNPDVADDAIFDRNRRLYDERLGVAGDLRVRLDDLEGLPWLTEVGFFSRFGRHKGDTQDRFLLDQLREPVAAPVPGETQRFRGNRRELDQRVSTFGGGLVFSPLAQLTGAADLSYERFREDAPEVTFGSLQGFTPACPPPATCLDRGFQFVPDTDRWTGTLNLSGSLGGATVEAGGFYTKLEQTGSGSLLQQDFRLGDTEVQTWSAQGAFDLPLGETYGLNGFLKYVHRDYDPVDDAYAAASPPGVAPPDGQVDPIYEKRRAFDGGLELTAKPVLGTLLGLGYRYEDIDRTLDFAEGPRVIRPEYNLMNDEARNHTVYARGRTRLFRRLQLSGELGWMWAPEVSYARDLERALSGKARVSYALPRPVPLSLALFGDFVDGENDDIFLQGLSEGRSKDYERTEWSYGATVTAMPTESLVLFSTFTQSRDEEEFAHLRSDLPRFFGPDVFYTDSTPLYKSDVRTFVVGGSYPLTEALSLSLSSSLTWVRVDYSNSNGTSTPGILDHTNDVRSRIGSIEARFDYQVRPGLRLGLGYRYDDYDHDHQHEPLPLPGLSPEPRFDATRNTVTIDVTLDFALFTGD